MWKIHGAHTRVGYCSTTLQSLPPCTCADACMCLFPHVHAYLFHECVTMLTICCIVATHLLKSLLRLQHVLPSARFAFNETYPFIPLLPATSSRALLFITTVTAVCAVTQPGSGAYNPVVASSPRERRLWAPTHRWTHS